MRRSWWMAVIILAATGANATPKFERQSADMHHEYTGGWEYFVGGGVAAFDCDGDFFPELFVAGGAGTAQLLKNQSNTVGNELEFQISTPDSLELTGVTGAYPLDVDSDGILDLAILRVGTNVLMRGLGDCQFAPFTDLSIRGNENSWTTAFSAVWENGHKLPTLAFGNYVDRSDPDGPFEACDQSWLYRPDGENYQAPLPLEPGYCTLSMLFSDWGRNGRADLRVTNDRHYYVRGGEEQLWAMESAPRLYGQGDGWQKYMFWGMGIASRDISGNGMPELFVTSMGDQKLQSLDEARIGPSYVDATFDRGTTAHRPYIGDDGRPSTGWHVAFGDVENDGLDDIFIAKGNVEQMPSSAMKDPNNLLQQQPDGGFMEVGDKAGIATFERSRGAALTDLNLDGLLDLVVVNRNAPVEVYRNVTENTGHWIGVKLHQPGENTFGIGSWVEVRTGNTVMSRELTIGGGHAGGSASFEHFGLGSLVDVELRVIWPGGFTGEWQAVDVDQFLSISRDGQVTAIQIH